MKFNFDIVMMFAFMILFVSLWGLELIDTWSMQAGIVISIIYWGLFWLICRKHDAIVSGDEQ